MEGLLYLAVGAFVLFLIIAVAVEMAVKEALFEFKEEVIKELIQRKAKDEEKN